MIVTIEGAVRTFLFISQVESDGDCLIMMLTSLAEYLPIQRCCLTIAEEQERWMFAVSAQVRVDRVMNFKLPSLLTRAGREQSRQFCRPNMQPEADYLNYIVLATNDDFTVRQQEEQRRRDCGEDMIKRGRLRAIGMSYAFLSVDYSMIEKSKTLPIAFTPNRLLVNKR